MNTSTPLPPPPPPPTTSSLAPPTPAPRPAPLGVTGPRTGPLGVSGVLWRVFAAVMVVSGLVWGVMSTVTVLAHDERVETETFPASGLDALVVTSANGWVRIVAAETDEVSVRAEISDGLRATGESRTIDDGTLQLRATCPSVGSDFCWVNYEVTVPTDLPITVSTDNGRITVTGTAADLTLRSDNGRIMVDDVSGAIDAHTDNGRIEGTALGAPRVIAASDNGRITLDFTVAPDSVQASSNNGHLDVLVPDDGTAYRTDLHTDNGREDISVPTDPNSMHTLVLDTDNGNITARSA